VVSIEIEALVEGSKRCVHRAARHHEFCLVGAPVNAGPVSGGGARDIAGFGGFFLSASSTNVYYSAGDRTAWCAEYYGVWNKAGQGAGPGAAGSAYTSALVQ